MGFFVGVIGMFYMVKKFGCKNVVIFGLVFISCEVFIIFLLFWLLFFFFVSIVGFGVGLVEFCVGMIIFIVIKER